jgi:hypothetical protein
MLGKRFPVFKHHGTKEDIGVGVRLQAFLTSAPLAGECLSFTLLLYYPRTRWVG